MTTTNFYELKIKIKENKLNQEEEKENEEKKENTETINTITLTKDNKHFSMGTSEGFYIISTENFNKIYKISILFF
jgi:hypothetical protein